MKKREEQTEKPSDYQKLKERKDMKKAEEQTNKPSAYSIGSFVRLYRSPSKRERNNLPHWNKYKDGLVGQVGLVYSENSSRKTLKVIFKNEDGETSSDGTETIGFTFLIFINMLEPVSDVPSNLVADLLHLRVRVNVKKVLRTHKEKQCRSFFGTAGSLVRVISKAPKKKFDKHCRWQNVKHTISKYGIVCCGLDTGCTAVLLPEPFACVFWYPDDWLECASWSDIEDQEQANVLKKLVSVASGIDKSGSESDESESDESESDESESDESESGDLRAIVKNLSLENVAMRKATTDLEDRVVLLEKIIETQQTPQ